MNNSSSHNNQPENDAAPLKSKNMIQRGLGLMNDPLNTLIELSKSKDPVVSIIDVGLMKVHIFLMNSAKAIETFFKSDSFQRDEETRRIINAVIVENLESITDIEEHRQRRKLNAPAYSNKHEHAYTATLKKVVTNHIAEIQGKSIDLMPTINELVLKCVGEIVLGITPDADTMRIIGQGTRALINTVGDRRLAIIKLPLSLPLPKYQNIRKVRKELVTKVYGIVEAKNNLAENTGEDVVSILLRTSIKVKDDAGVEQRLSLTTKEVMGDTIAALLAGNDTLTNTLTWTIYFLLKNPETLEKLKEELREQDIQKMSFKQIRELPYLEAVLKEGLRLRTPAFASIKENIEDVTVEGTFIPQGSTIMVSAYAQQLKSDYFDDPLNFIPDRWLVTENSNLEKDIPSGAYFPFGEGEYGCIAKGGEGMAMQMLQIILASLIKNLDFKALNPDAEYVPLAIASLPPGGEFPVEVSATEYYQANREN